jgi:hypothetical protein
METTGEKQCKKNALKMDYAFIVEKINWLKAEDIAVMDSFEVRCITCYFY